jgi:hypothetical protein
MDIALELSKRLYLKFFLRDVLSLVMPGAILLLTMSPSASIEPISIVLARLRPHGWLLPVFIFCLSYAVGISILGLVNLACWIFITLPVQGLRWLWCRIFDMKFKGDIRWGVILDFPPSDTRPKHIRRMARLDALKKSDIREHRERLVTLRQTAANMAFSSVLSVFLWRITTGSPSNMLIGGLAILTVGWIVMVLKLVTGQYTYEKVAPK